jgi:retron-type reverse transcriptase
MNHLPPYISLQYAEDLVTVLQDEFSLDADEVSKATKLLENKLPPLVRPQILSFLFGVSYSFINTMSTNSQRYYRIYRITKKAGGYRRIEAPRRFIKLIQRWIYMYILSTHELPETVTGFARGKNIFSNAQPHIPNKNLMVVDIKDFFPSIDYQDVYRTFKSFGFPTRVNALLSRLCTLHRRLPQGAPTSPALANLVFLPVDLALQDLAKSWDCAYSRYADDIAFSGNAPFSKKHTKAVSEILKDWGFRTNYRKTRIIGGGGKQILTGLVVNTSGLPPRQKRRRWRAMFHQASAEPSKFLGKSQSLTGISAFVNQYDPKLASRYFDVADKVAHLEDNK